VSSVSASASDQISAVLVAGMEDAFQKPLDRFKDALGLPKSLLMLLAQTAQAEYESQVRREAEIRVATYPEELCETPIKAGCPINGIVLDPFAGAGTT